MIGLRPGTVFRSMILRWRLSLVEPGDKPPAAGLCAIPQFLRESENVQITSHTSIAVGYLETPVVFAEAPAQSGNDPATPASHGIT
jgi:hypothetical protein